MTTVREETSRLVDLLRREHRALADFLVALAAFDAERRWAELGYPSLFPFLVRELGLSKGAAYYRKAAAELVLRHPEVLEALREGKLCLTSIVELSKVISPENQAEILPRFFQLSKREAKEIAAELLPDPAPPLRTVVTTPISAGVGRGRPLLLAAAPGGAAAPAICATPPVGAAPSAGAAPAASGDAVAGVPVFRPTTCVPTSPVSDGASALPPGERERTEIEPLDRELRRLHVTVSRRLLEKLDAARDALSHSHPGATDDDIIQLGLDLVLERQAKRRGLVKKPRKPAPVPTAPASVSVPSSTPSPSAFATPTAPANPTPSATAAARRSRYIPAEVRRAVWQRDRGCCQWPVGGGGVCASTLRVEIDHIDGWANGAGATLDELRLLCRVHQDGSARQLYGDAVMNNYTRRKGGTCSEPVAAYRTSGIASGDERSARSGRGMAGTAAAPPAYFRPGPGSTPYFFIFPWSVVGRRPRSDAAPLGP